MKIKHQKITAWNVNKRNITKWSFIQNIILTKSNSVANDDEGTFKLIHTFNWWNEKCSIFLMENQMTKWKFRTILIYLKLCILKNIQRVIEIFHFN